MNLDKIAEKAAYLHDVECNQKYDKYPYSYHLNEVVVEAKNYLHLLDPKHREIVIATAWLHDSIEDARQTYNNIKNIVLECGGSEAEAFEVAEAVRSVTSDIRGNLFGYYVKICDRFVNMKYSYRNNSSMFETYKKEIWPMANPKNVDKGLVISGHRHHNCIHFVNSVFEKTDSEAGERVEGFLTSQNRFVDRVEAAKLAFE